MSFDSVSSIPSHLGAYCLSQAWLIPRDSKPFTWECIFHIKLTNPQTIPNHFLYQTLIFPHLKYQVSNNPPLASRACWIYSNKSILSLLILPLPFLSMKTTIETLVYISPLAPSTFWRTLVLPCMAPMAWHVPFLCTHEYTKLSFWWQLFPNLLASPELHKNKSCNWKHSRKPQSHGLIHIFWTTSFVIMSLFVLGVNSAGSATTPTGAFTAQLGQKLINGSTFIKRGLFSVLAMHTESFCLSCRWLNI